MRKHSIARAVIVSLIFTCLYVLLAAFSFVVYAHPGRTDENGGHTDHSTGEYHYHHGQPEHDHYDMDGDGDIDCPYKFEDKTGLTSGGPSGDRVNTPATVPPNTVPVATKSNSVDTENYNEDWSGLLIYAGIIVAILLFVSIRKAAPHLRNYLKRRKEHRRFIKSHHLPKRLIPRGIYIRSDGQPTFGRITPTMPFGSFTVFVSQNGSCFHVSQACAKGSKPINVFQTRDKLAPCCTCAKKWRGVNLHQNWYIVLESIQYVKKQSNS